MITGLIKRLSPYLSAQIGPLTHLRWPDITRNTQRKSLTSTQATAPRTKAGGAPGYGTEASTESLRATQTREAAPRFFLRLLV